MQNNQIFAIYSIPKEPRTSTVMRHHCPVIDITKYYNPNVLELSVTTLDVLIFHTFIPPTHSNPFTSLSLNSKILPQLLHTRKVDSAWSETWTVHGAKRKVVTRITFAD